MKKVFIVCAVVFAFMFVALVLAAGCVLSSNLGFIHGDWSNKEKATREESRSFALASGKTLRLGLSNGDVEVTTGIGDPSLSATITAYDDTKEEAQKLLDTIKIVIDESGDGAAIRVEDKDGDLKNARGSTKTKAKVDFKISVPEGVHLALDLSSGDVSASGKFADSDVQSGYGKVTVSGSDGDLAAKSGSGDVAVSCARGKKLAAETGYGDVRVGDCEFDALRAKSGSGDVALFEVRAARVEARSGYGDVKLRKVGGEVEAVSGSGSVKADGLSGSHFTLKSGYGDVEARNATGKLSIESSSGSVRVGEFKGEVEAKSGYGDVHVDGVLQGLTAESSSGSVDVTALAGSKVASEWRLHSGYGSVELGLPADLPFTLSAKTGYGEVDLDLPIEVAAGGLKKGNAVQGKINGGGETIRAESGSGDVKIHPVKAP